MAPSPQIAGLSPSAAASPGDAGARADADSGATHAELLQRAATRMPVMLRIMKQVAKRVIAEHAPRVATIGEGQWRALHVLYDDGTLQVGELAQRCGVADPTVSKMLRSLEHHGLIERQTDPENRRMVWVSLTAKGQGLVDEIQASFEQGLAQVLQGLSSEQLRDLLRTVSHLERLVATPESA